MHPCVEIAVRSKSSTKYIEGRKRRWVDAVMPALWRESLAVTLCSVIPRYGLGVLGAFFTIGMRAPHCVPISLAPEWRHIGKASKSQA